MKIQIVEHPGSNTYISSLMLAYERLGHILVCNHNNFFYSNFIPDILHIHWPDRLYMWGFPLTGKPHYEIIKIITERLKWYKSVGSIIVYTSHDLKPHHSEHQELDKNIFNLIISFSDLIIHHCEASIALLNDLYPLAKKKEHLINHHGDYLISFKSISKLDAKKKLNIESDKYVILNFGSQQAYKGMEFIENVFNTLKIKSKFLLNAGYFSYSGLTYSKRFILRVRNDFRQKIKFNDKKYIYRRISEDEIPVLFNASDIVFLGHNAGLASGVIPMAETYAKPVVYPEIGCFEEQMNGWIGNKYKVNNVSQAVSAISELHNKQLNNNLFLNNSNWLKLNSWENHVLNILNKINELKLTT